MAAASTEISSSGGLSARPPCLDVLSGNTWYAPVITSCRMLGAIVLTVSPILPSRVETSGGRVRIADATISAASSGELVGKLRYIPVGAIIGVRTSGMWMLVLATPSSATSGAMQRLSAASADFDAT